MGKCKFQTSWLDKTDGLGLPLSSWLKKGRDDSDGFCIVCETYISVTKGFQSIVQHYTTEKHKKRVSTKLTPLQLRLMQTASVAPMTASASSSSHQPASLQLYGLKDSASRAELIWALKTVANNYSADSCDGIADVFKAMFPSAVPDGFSLGHTKLAYLITEALGPYFRGEMLKDAAGACYSLLFDETTNAENKKELQVKIRFWSNKHEKIVSKHLETFFLGHATGEDISSNLLNAVENSGLLLTNMIFLGSDGPNVNKTVHRLVNAEVVRRRGGALLNLGSCNIHIVHNAFLKGLSELGEECSDAAIAVFYFFDGFPSRWEDYTKIQDSCKIQNKKFIHHVTSRWLTLRDSCERLLEQSTALEKYFLYHIPNKNSDLMKTKKYKTVLGFLKNPMYKPELSFVISSAELFSGFTKKFQSDYPLAHKLYDELKAICLTLVNRVCQPTVVKDIYAKTVWDSEVIFSSESLLNVKDVVVGDDVSAYLKEKTTKDVLHFLERAQKHYIRSCQHILNKSSICTSSTANFLKWLRFMQPEEISSSRSVSYISKAAKALHSSFGISTDVLLDEWKALQLQEPLMQKEKMSIDEFWKGIFNLKNVDGLALFPTVAKMVKACLSISHGNADVERGFSQSGRISTWDKASMSLSMLNARQYIKDHLLEKKKNEVDRKKKEEVEREEKIKAENEANEELKKRKKSIVEMELQLKELKSEEKDRRKTNEKLFDIAQEKLKKALEEKNIGEAKVAHVMLQRLNVSKKEETSLKRKVEELENKKSSLITKFFKKI